MALTVLWEGGDSSTAVASGSYIGFFGSTFNSSIPLDGYNSVTVVTNSISTVNSGALPNVKYTTPGYGIWVNPTNGTVSGSIDSATTDDMTLHIRITSGSAVRLSSVNLVAYKGSDINAAPDEVSVVGFEQGTSNWSAMEGLASPLALTPHTSTALSTHDYYIGISLSPITTTANTVVSLALIADWY